MDTQTAANLIGRTKIVIGANDKALLAHARDSLAPGVYPVDQTLHVNGTITIGEDFDVTPTVSIPIKETLALFIAYSGITRDAAIKALRKAMQHSIAIDGTGAGELATTLPIINQTMATVEKEILQQLPRQDRKGLVTSKLTVTEVVTV